MKINDYAVQRTKVIYHDPKKGWVQDIHVEFNAEVDENEFKRIFDFLLDGNIPEEVKR